MNARIYLKFLLLLGLCVSCVKDDTNLPPCETNCTIVNGRFLTDDYSMPISNVKLTLEWGTRSELGGSTRIIAKTETDKDGYYSFQFYVKDFELTHGDFSISFINIGDQYLQQDYPYFRFGTNKRDTIVIYNYNIPRKVYIKFDFSNVCQTDSCHVLVYMVYFAGGETNYFTTIDSRNYNSQTFEIGANQYTYLNIVKIIDNIRNEHSDSIKVSFNNTEVYRIEN